MGKNKTTVVTEVSGIDKDKLFINENKMRNLSKDIEKQLAIISDSLSNLSNSLDVLVNNKVVTGNRIDSYKSWSKRAKSQANAADKLIDSLHEKTNVDLQLYPIQLLDERIAELEKKIASLTNE
jgi:uncharacterized small protein (DUF1192 family)